MRTPTLRVMQKMSKQLATVAIMLSMVPGIGAAQSAESVLGYPDMIVHNARIITMDDASFSSSPGTISEAMAIRDDTILAVGSSKQMRSLAGPDTHPVDLNGRTVLPGTIDNLQP